MFTPGFRLFSGFSFAAIIAAIAYGFFSGDKSGIDAFGVVDRDLFKGIISLGWNGSVGEHLGYVVFVMLAFATALLGATMIAFRDADVESVAELGETGEIPSPQAPTEANYWPAAGALGVGVFIVGLGISKAIWILGLAILAVVAFEWMLSAWADRATGDPAANAKLRSELMGPIELPVIALAGVAIIAIAVSRVLLAVSATGAVIAAGVIATIIFGFATLFAARPNIAKPIIATVVALGAVAIIAGGIVSAAVGQRDFHHEEHGEDHSTEGDHEGEALDAVVVSE